MPPSVPTPRSSDRTAATQMTDGVLSPDALAARDPALVSPGLLALVGDDAPTRAILCAGGGHFARANVTLTEGGYVGRTDTAAADRVVAARSEEHTSELQSLMRISYAVYCLTTTTSVWVRADQMNRSSDVTPFHKAKHT